MIARVHPAGVVAHHPSVRSTRGGVGRRESCANFSQQLVSLHLEAPESVAQSGGDQRSRGLDEVDAPDARPPRQWGLCCRAYPFALGSAGAAIG
jgi:hypothetical protein